MAKKKKLTKREKQKEKFWFRFFVIFIISMIILLSIIIAMGEKTGKEFDNAIKQFCEKQGWIFSKSYRFIGGECIKLEEDFVNYYELEIINKTIYIVKPGYNYYDIVIYYYANNQSQSGTIERRPDNRDNYLIPELSGIEIAPLNFR
jgi:hypothetical protein